MATNKNKANIISDAYVTAIKAQKNVAKLLKNASNTDKSKATTSITKYIMSNPDPSAEHTKKIQNSITQSIANLAAQNQNTAKNNVRVAKEINTNIQQVKQKAKASGTVDPAILAATSAAEKGTTLANAASKNTTKTKKKINKAGLGLKSVAALGQAVSKNAKTNVLSAASNNATASVVKRIENTDGNASAKTVATTKSAEKAVTQAKAVNSRANGAASNKKLSGGGSRRGNMGPNR